MNSLEMLVQMCEYRREKLDGWELNKIEMFPVLREMQAITYLGSFAWTQPHTKIKWMKERFCYNIGGGVVTPSDIARDYLANKFGGVRLKCTTKQYDDFVRNRIHQPLYAELVNDMDCYYLDLKSAYWQILMCGGWDVEYSRNSYLSVRSDVFDFPVPHIKLARNSLVSMGLPAQGTLWNPEKGLQKVRGGSSTVNLVLYGFAMDVLHAVGSEMIDRAGAVYVNTDGYIVPKYMAEEAFKIADEWNMRLELRYDGLATVRGAGDYDIGKARSKRPRQKAHPFNYIIPPKIEWLKKRWNYFSHRIDFDFTGAM